MENLLLRALVVLGGILVLTLGRKLFWLAVGLAGFVLGLVLATRLVGQQPDLLVLVVALLAGVIGAVLAILAQKVAAGVLGFFVGGYLVAGGLQWLGLELGGLTWLFFGLGGVLGALLALSLLEVVLIGLTALAGAMVILQATNFSPLVSGVLFLVLVLIGIGVQFSLLSKSSEG